MVANKAARLLIRRLELYGSLSDDDKAVLLGMDAATRTIRAGKDLVLEGAMPESAFVIVEGFACRYQLSCCGSRQITAYLLPGDFCDLDALLLSRMDHCVGALSSCTLAQLTPATVQELLKRPAIARALRLATLAETANLREWLVNLGTRRAPSRVAHLICGLLVRLRAVGLADFDSFDFPLTQVDLADTLGMSTVHMNRSLQDLRSAQLIELCRNRLTIPNSAKLEAFARSRVKFPHLERTAA